jgi:hypothetical protein
VTPLPKPAAPGYTALAVAAVTDAAKAEQDFGGWPQCSPRSRPGSAAATPSPQAALAWVIQLVKGTVGQADEGLDRYRPG